MKAFIFTALSCTVLFASAQKHGSMPVGYHEFRIFGEKQVYLSHFPMFSSIHAFQVIVAVNLDADSAKRFAQHLKTNPDTRYTLSPYRNVPPTAAREKDQDDWVLPDTMKVGSRFTGDIHYTSNDEDVTLVHNVTVSVEKIIEKRELNPKDSQPRQLTYLLFGTAEEPYLAHLLSAPPNPGEETPDFDQVLKVTLVSGDMPKNGVGTYVLPKKRNDRGALLKEGQTETLVNAAQASVKLSVDAVLQNSKVGTQR